MDIKNNLTYLILSRILAKDYKIYNKLVHLYFT